MRTGSSIDIGEISWRRTVLYDEDGNEISDTTKPFNKDSKLHRLDGPAVERANGDKEWYQNDKRHRLDGPALKRSDGYEAWYQNGKFHQVYVADDL